MLFGRKDRKPIVIPPKPVKEWKYATCNYCSTGCTIELGINADGKVITFVLQDGVRFHNGKEFTSADVKYTFDELFKMDHGVRVPYPAP